MFDSLHHFLYSNSPWVVPLALIVAAFFSYRIWVILHAQLEPVGLGTGPHSRRTPRPQPADSTPAKPLSSTGPIPSATPIQQQFLGDKPAQPASTTAGEESHKHKAQAQTIRIRSDDQRHSTSGSSPTELLPNKGDEASVGDEVGKLFAGLDDALQPAPEAGASADTSRSSDSQRRASRLEVLGFHHSIESNLTPPPGSITAPPETPPSPALDDILARLDRVLAEDQPAKPAPAAAAAQQAKTEVLTATDAKPPAAKAPVWARADAQDEDLETKPVDPGQQLGLFDGDKKA